MDPDALEADAQYELSRTGDDADAEAHAREQLQQAEVMRQQQQQLAAEQEAAEQDRLNIARYGKP